MLRAASFAAIVLYLLPVAVVLACRARRGRALWAAGLDVPLAVSADLLLVLGLSRLVTLEVATLASRALWLGGGLAYLTLARGRPEASRPAWPRAAGARAVVITAATAAVATWLSMLGSRPYAMWDCKWHMPLVASLRGQKLPFDNVFRRGEVLHYHFAGDVHAAMVQTLSGDVLHATLALSVAHDVLFGLLGATVALLLLGLGHRRLAPAALAVLAALLAGPFTLGLGPTRTHAEGYSILNYFTMSFRPHDALAGLFLLGLAGALAARVSEETRARAPLGDTVPALLVTTAGLGISDETSLGLVGLALGLTWLLFPRVLHPRRAGGALVLAGLLIAFLGPNLAFAASIAPGAQRHAVALVAWRSPGYGHPALLLAAHAGMERLLADLGPTALLWLGTALGAVAARRRGAAWPLGALATALFVLSAVSLTAVEVNHDHEESHRFMTAGLLLAPVLALLVLRERRPRWPLLRAAGVAVAALGAAAGAASTVDWIASVVPAKRDARETFFTSQDLSTIDCRRDLAATLGERPRPTYLAKTLWYAYAGCHPTFSPARHDMAWALTIGYPLFEKEALRTLVAERLRAGERLRAICPRGAAQDPVCAYAIRSARCHDVGKTLTECELTPAQQAEAAR